MQDIAYNTDIDMGKVITFDTPFVCTLIFDGFDHWIVNIL